MKPAAAAPAEICTNSGTGIEQDLLAEHDQEHRGREIASASERQRALPGAQVSRAVRCGRRARSARGTTSRLARGPAATTERDDSLPARKTHGDRQRERQPGARLEEQQPRRRPKR